MWALSILDSRKKISKFRVQIVEWMPSIVKQSRAESRGKPLLVLTPIWAYLKTQTTYSQITAQNCTWLLMMLASNCLQLPVPRNTLIRTLNWKFGTLLWATYSISNMNSKRWSVPSLMREMRSLLISLHEARVKRIYRSSAIDSCNPKLCYYVIENHQTFQIPMIIITSLKEPPSVVVY